jgi:predicted RNA polymerase sigma factor
VVHLLFTTGHTTPAGEVLVRRDLVERSVELARMLRRLLPQDPAVAGLLALLLLTDARRETRTGTDGRLLLLEEQDRSRWDHGAIAEGVALVRAALRVRPPTRYALQAAIAAVHAEAPDAASTDWEEIVALYDLLVRVAPSPVVELNRAMAVSSLSGPERGLELVDGLLARGELADYHLAHAARADLCARLGRDREARASYERALALARQEPERRFFERRLRELGD